MKLNKKTIIILIAILVVAVGVIYSLATREPAIVRIIKGEEETILELEYLSSHPESTVFPVVVRSSGKKPVETEYEGVEMFTILESLNIDTSNVEKVTFNASDGYKIILKLEEIKEPKNMYLTYKRDGKLLKSKKRGGNGPFQLVIRRDPFSQRWIKHVNEIILE